MPKTAMIIPADWMPDAKMRGIVVHWTAGAQPASSFDKKHYHVLIEKDGSLTRGKPTIDLNSQPKVKPGYAAHTAKCNTGFIGISFAGMALAVESPFDPGKHPITADQWKALPGYLAQLCKRYGIKVDAKTVLSHAEVQGTLGIPQAGKWDIARLPFDPSLKGATAIGDAFRKATAALL